MMGTKSLSSKEHEIGMACSLCGRDVNTEFKYKIQKERDSVEGLSIDGRIIAKESEINRIGGCGVDSSGSG
jgi:hypothetical protein